MFITYSTNMNKNYPFKNKHISDSFFVFIKLANETVMEISEKDDQIKCSEDSDRMLSRKWDALPFSERKFYQDVVRKIVSHIDEEDNSSICSEDNERVYILDSEDDAFRVSKSY